MKQDDCATKRVFFELEDDWTKREWEAVKSVLEHGFEHVYGIKVYPSDREVFEGVLFCFENEIGSFFFPERFDDGELDEMIKRNR
ncbi:MAG: hypothetical protein WBW25_07590 [Halobacteriota archaeon]